MLEKQRISLIGGDLRQIYLAKELNHRGHSVLSYASPHHLLDKSIIIGESLEKATQFGDIIILPTPVTKDGEHIISLEDNKSLTISNFCKELHKNHIVFGGNIPTLITKFCDLLDIPYYDFMKIEKVAILNSIATAEGAIMEAIRQSSRNLHDSNCLVLGYGRCGSVLAHKLWGLHANVWIGVRNDLAMYGGISHGYQGLLLSQLKEKISQFDYIFNSIPEVILSHEILDELTPATTIIDIASYPGGLDYNYAENRQINAHLCLGLPGKVSPQSCGEILEESFTQIMKERSE